MRVARFPRAAVVPLTRRWKKGAYHLGQALGDRVLVGRTPGGSPMVLSMRDHQHRAIYFYGEYEPEITAVFRRLVTPGATVFDIGANAGFFSLLSRELGATVHAFEPNPQVRALLTRSVELGTGDIEVVPCACSDDEGTMPFYLSDPGNTGRSGLLVPRDTCVDVDVITVDGYVQRTNAHPQLVKVDVEGAEASVLRGMRETLRTDRPTLVIELHGDKREEVASVLESAGYEQAPEEADAAPGEASRRSHIIARPR
jgi:FkbM family methyltransferase